MEKSAKINLDETKEQIEFLWLKVAEAMQLFRFWDNKMESMKHFE